MTIRKLSKYKLFFQFAIELSKLSMCKRDKVGCICFPEDCSRINAIGYNGPARGLSNDTCTNRKGECGCAHAEANAIAKGGHDILFTTKSPCRTCTNLIINCGRIHTVIFKHHYREDSTNLFMMTGIRIYSQVAWEARCKHSPLERSL